MRPQGTEEHIRRCKCKPRTIVYSVSVESREGYMKAILLD